MKITAGNMHFQELNEKVKSASGDVLVDECYGQRFIASGAKGKTITINGTPGNALGAYLDGATIQVNGNVQDAVGDTMNEGKIIVHGNAGDALGYAMRGGTIFIKGDAGYRTGIHMKEYNEKKPVIVIGGSVGSFLGEYLAGGVIIVLGLGAEDIPVGYFTGTGMHGGRIYIRTNATLEDLPSQVIAEEATPGELAEIQEFTSEFAKHFDISANFANDRFLLLKPNAKNPYKQLYTEN
jgi:glutamate synthase domain-containing protein 3